MDPMKVLKEKRSKLDLAFTFNIKELADLMNVKGFLSDSDHETVADVKSMLGDREKASIMVSSLIKKVELNSKNCSKFLGLVKKGGRKFQDVVDLLDVEPIDELEDIAPLPKRHCQVPVGVSTISRYKTFLQCQYEKTKVAFDDKLNIAPCHQFIKLIIVDKNREASNKAPNITLENIISSDDKFVLVEAAPGMGKSTFSLELCRNWDVFQDLQRFEIILLLRLREPRVQKISSLSDVFFHDDKSLSDCIVQEVFMREGSKVLFIFDGYDELPASYFESTEWLLSRLISGECLPLAVRLITTRPSVLYKLNGQLQSYKHVEITGFDDESKVKFARVAFQSKPDFLLSQFEILVSSNPYINSLMDIPVNCAIIVSLFEDLFRGRQLPNTMTELFSRVTVSLIRRHKIGIREWSVEEEIPEFNQLADKVGDAFNNVCQLAYNSIFDRLNLFQISQNTLFDHLGLMVETKEMYVDKGAQTTFSFFHRIFHSFLAASFASQSQDFDINERFQNIQEYDEPFFLFYYGLSKPSKPSSLFDGEVLMPIVFKCAYESQDPSIISLVSNRMVLLKSNLDLYILGYFLVHFRIIWRISLIPPAASLAPLATSIQYHQKLNNQLQGSIAHITDLYGEATNYIILLPDSLVQRIFCLEIGCSVFIPIDLRIMYLLRNLLKITLILDLNRRRRVPQSRVPLSLHPLVSLPHLQEIDLTLYSLPQNYSSELIDILNKQTLRHVRICLYPTCCKFSSTHPFVIHALFTSTFIESVIINFDLEIAALYFSSTKIKELTYTTQKVCEVIPYINYGLKINPRLKFKIYCRKDTNQMSISSLAKAYHMSPTIISEKMPSKAKPWPVETYFIPPSFSLCGSRTLFFHDLYKCICRSDWKLEHGKVRRRYSCPEILYIHTISNIPKETNERMQFSFFY